MQKIHRRKNEQIPKDFICTEGCGKAYGSHAALYTHMKNKHGCLKVINPKGDNEKIKTGKKGRPLTKQKQAIINCEVNIQNVCKLCFQDQCICDSSINSYDIQKNITMMSDRVFLKLLNCIGNLNIGESFTWIRSTDEDFQLFSKERLYSLIEQLNLKMKTGAEIHLTDRWQDYLIYLSKFIDTKYVNELFQGIFLIMSQKNYKEVDFFKNINQEVKNLKKCSDQKKKQWSQFVEIVISI